jgi:hypothetical protein
MQKWEYQSVTDRQGHPSELLEENGNEGWELVTVVIENDSEGTYNRFYFKRPKP